jgi:hypothetical protein
MWTVRGWVAVGLWVMVRTPWPWRRRVLRIAKWAWDDGWGLLVGREGMRVGGGGEADAAVGLAPFLLWEGVS